MLRSEGQNIDKRRLSFLLHPDKERNEKGSKFYRKTKIVCTIGPRTSSVPKIVELVGFIFSKFSGLCSYESCWILCVSFTVEAWHECVPIKLLPWIA